MITETKLTEWQEMCDTAASGSFLRFMGFVDASRVAVPKLIEEVRRLQGNVVVLAAMANQIDVLCTAEAALRNKLDRLSAEVRVSAMTFSGFSELNRRRCEAAEGFNHALDSWSLSDWMTATVGELGEAANVAKKLNRVRDGVPGNKETAEELRSNLAEEIADTFIYLDLLAQSQGLDLGTTVRNKFNKTSLKIGSSVVCE